MSSVAVPPAAPHGVRARLSGIARGRLLPGVLLVFLGVSFLGLDEADRTVGTDAGGWVLVAGGASLILLGAYERLRAARAEALREEHRARAEVEQAIDRIGSEVDLRDLLRVNRRQMEAYEVLTRRQAASSYRLSHLALAIGLAVVVTGSVWALRADETSTQVVAAALSTVAAAISGFIARTYLRIYERTLEQLNHYFEQPLVSSYVLTAERLIDKMGAEHRDGAYAKVVEELMDWRTPSPVRPPRKAAAKAKAPAPAG